MIVGCTIAKKVTAQFSPFNLFFHLTESWATGHDEGKEEGRRIRRDKN